MFRCRLDKLIDMKQREVVLRTCLVKFSEVDANSPLSILLFHDDGIGQSVGVFNLTDGTDTEKVFDLVVNILGSPRAELTHILFNGLKPGSTLS